jgi:hypothetical protein
MITGRPDVVNPYNFVDIFKSNHKSFDENECTYILCHINMVTHVVLSYCFAVVL